MANTGPEQLGISSTAVKRLMAQLQASGTIQRIGFRRTESVALAACFSSANFLVAVL